MATQVNLPREMVIQALTQAIALRKRQIGGALNKLIAQALEDEVRIITNAINTVTDQPDKPAK